MMIFDYTDYRDFLQETFKGKRRKKNCNLSLAAKKTGIHPSVLSQVLAHSRDLSPDQALQLARFLKQTLPETEYFLSLVNYSRATASEYKDFLKDKIKEQRSEALNASKWFTHDAQMSNENKATFYSSWIYSAIRLFCSTNEAGVSLDQMEQRFIVPRQKIVEVVQFLLSTGMITEEKGKYKMGPLRTYLEFGSPYLVQHHSNWRLQAIQKTIRLTKEELMFTSTLSVSKDDFQKIKKNLLKEISQVSKIVAPSKAEDVACLNIDLFWIDGA